MHTINQGCLLEQLLSAWIHSYSNLKPRVLQNLPRVENVDLIGAQAMFEICSFMPELDFVALFLPSLNMKHKNFYGYVLSQYPIKLQH